MLEKEKAVLRQKFGRRASKFDSQPPDYTITDRLSYIDSELGEFKFDMLVFHDNFKSLALTVEKFVAKVDEEDEHSTSQKKKKKK